MGTVISKQQFDQMFADYNAHVMIQRQRVLDQINHRLQQAANSLIYVQIVHIDYDITVDDPHIGYWLREQLNDAGWQWCNTSAQSIHRGMQSIEIKICNPKEQA